MTRIFSLATICSALFAFQANADLVCSNGTIETLGDAYFQITVLEDGIEFSPYESSFSVDAGDSEYKDDTISILNKTVTMSSESEESSQVINAVLIFNDKDTKLNLAISYDRGPFTSYEMTCEDK